MKSHGLIYIFTEIEASLMKIKHNNNVFINVIIKSPPSFKSRQKEDFTGGAGVYRRT